MVAGLGTTSVAGWAAAEGTTALLIAAGFTVGSVPAAAINIAGSFIAGFAYAYDDRWWPNSAPSLRPLLVVSLHTIVSCCGAVFPKP